MAEHNFYQAQMEAVIDGAATMKRALLDPFREDDGSFFEIKTKADKERKDKILESAISGTAYANLESGPMIAASNARALQGYEKRHGHLPTDDLLASAYNSIQNAILFSKGRSPLNGVFEAADMSTTDGILLRDRLISLVLPVHLQMITSPMVTFIPGSFNQSEFFRIKRVAGSNFGDLKKGDIIDYDYQGQYSVMDQRHRLPAGNGTQTEFTYSSTVGTVAYPFKPKRTRVWVNNVQVAQDNGEGIISGAFTAANSSTVVVSGTVDYAGGTAKVNFSVPPNASDVIHIGYDVDIEKDPTLIPRIDHQMWSKTLYPHESAITGNATIQAIYTLRRELGQDIENLIMQGLRNLLAADKDRKHLHDMLFHATNVVEWCRTPNEHLTLQENYETLNAALLEVDSVLMNGNGVSGLVGIVAGTKATNIFRYLPAPFFSATPDYRSIAQPHYVGRVFGQWDLYCDPQMEDWVCLCFARGTDHGQTAYVAGDAVPALTFNHPVLGDLVKRGTLWDLAYRDMQPFDGSSYLCKLHFVEG